MATITTSENVNYGLRSTRASSDKWGNWTEASITHTINYGQTIPTGARIDAASVTVHVSGQPIVGSYFYVNGQSARTTVGDHSITLSHVAAGSSSFTLTITFKGTGTKNTTAVLNLNRIDFNCTYTPTQSKLTLSAAAFDAGESITAEIVPAVASYTHKLAIAFGNRAEEMAVEGTLQAFTIPLKWLDQIPNSGSGAGTVTLYTYDGGTLIGQDEKDITVYAPDSAAPIIEHTEEPVYNVGGVTYPDVTGGGYVQERSALKATAKSITAQYGASITRQTITVGKETTTGGTLTTGLLQQSGAVNVVYTATDSRGITVTYTETITVKAYQVPAVQELRVQRVDDTGTASDTGTKAAGSVSFTWSKLDGKNKTATVKIQYSIAGGGWTTLQETETEEGSLSFTADGPFTVETKVTFRAVIGDAYSTIYTAEKEEALEMGWIARWIRHDGKGVAFGQASTKENGFQIRGEWDFYKGESKIMIPTVTSKNYGGAYFNQDAGTGTTLSTFTVEESGVYIVQWNLWMVSALSGRSYLEFFGRRASFANGSGYPCTCLTVIGQFEEGTSYPLTFYADTGGYLQYEECILTKVRIA